MSNDNKVFASPGPAGLMVLAFYLACLWPIATGFVDHSLSVVLVPLGLAGAIVQMTSGIIELRNGHIFPGNIMMAFSAFMWYGCIANLLKALDVMPADTAMVDGLVFLVMGILMVGFTPAFLMQNTVASIFMLATDVFFLGAAFSWITGSSILWLIGGWALPFVVVSIIWQVLGEMYNTAFMKEVIPMGNPMINKKKPIQQPVQANV